MPREKSRFSPKNTMSNQEYDVFICHRIETKRNVVSVLAGMLMSKGITCFVDYQMSMGTDLLHAIDFAIQSSKVFIIVLSPDFPRSRWCLGEISKIMEIGGVEGTAFPPRKVIPVFYEVQRDMVLRQEKGTLYDLSKMKRSDAAEIERWGKALKDVCSLEGFVYDSKTTFQWEKLEEIVAEVENFLISQYHIIPHQGTKMPISREFLNHDVFICHHHLDTQRNVVSVLRGMLLSKGITSFVVGYGNDDGGDELNSDIVQAIENSLVHVIFLSPHFVSSKRCLEQADYITNIQYSAGTSSARRMHVVPIFYDMRPSEVRYNVPEVQQSTREERERWASALHDLSCRNGFEYDSKSTFQWETLDYISREVESFMGKVRSWNNGLNREILYLQKINELLEELDPQEKSDNVFVVGVYGRKKSEFSNLLVGTLGGDFDRVCMLNNVMEKACRPGGISSIVREILSDLFSENLWYFVRRRQTFLQDERCLVVLDDVGNDIHELRKLLEEVKRILRNGSLVVLASQFQILRELDVHKFINLSSLENKRDFLNICYAKRDGINEAFLSSLEYKRDFLNVCYAKRDGINEAFLSHLVETFDMLGVDVRLLNVDEIMSDSTSLRDAKAILCIVSKSLRNSDFMSMFANAAVPSKIVYVSYGSNPTDTSTPRPFSKIEVDFEKAELDIFQFKRLVNEVVQALNERDEKINGAIDFPVALARRSTDIVCRIFADVSWNDTSVVRYGLLGMGGSGKTALAMSIFNKIHSKFESSSFILNTRAQVGGRGTLGLVSVQKKILADLLSLNEDVMIDDEIHGKMVLSSMPKNINALVILDDVDDVKHLDALYEPLKSCLGPKSVVIITSRDRGVLELAQPTRIFVVERLDEEMSKRLFCWHAFMKPSPPAHLEEVSQRVIEACEGLPLSLKVVGSRLYLNSDRSDWEEILHLLIRGDRNIFEVLRISFDALGNMQKEAFLDICCFLIGEAEEFARMVLDAIYKLGRTFLDSLEERCLITITADDDDAKVRRIRVHDQLRDMGRHIIRLERRDCAWNDESADDILQDEKAGSSLRGLSVSGHFLFPKEASDCRCLPELRILVVEEEPQSIASGSENKGGLIRKIFSLGIRERERHSPRNFFNDVRCDELRWLRWKRAPFKELPHGLCSRHLRVLELLESNISKVPMASLQNLQHLDLSYCQNLKALDSSIERLTNLRYLNLRKCTRLTFLPQEMKSISCLEQLNLDGCSCLFTLSFLPTSLRKLTARMDKNEPGSLKSVADASLPKLEDLSITYCPNLKRLDLNTTSLQRLELTGCSGLEEFYCQDGTGLSCLEQLNLDRCSCLITLSFLPTTLRKLTLHMDDKEPGSLEGVADATLPKLEELSITYCPKVKRLGLNLTSLRRLDLTGCSGLEEFYCQGLSSLEYLNLIGCSCLTTRSFLPKTVRTLTLDVDEREPGSLVNVEDASLANLEELSITDCPNLTLLALDWTSLHRLDLMGCSGLQNLNLRRCAGLQRLDLTECRGLKELDCEGFSSMQELILDACQSLTALPFLPTTLRKLSLKISDNEVGSLACVGEVLLPNLEELYITRCPELKKLTLHASSLQRLNLTFCGGLEDLYCKGLSCLQHLILDECSSLTTLSFPLPTTLQKLKFSGSRSLDIEDLNMLSLHVPFCELEEVELEDPSCLKQKFLRLLSDMVGKELGNLKSLTDASLPKLEDLTITYCPKLKRLGLNLTSLQRLDLTGCTGINEFYCQGLSCLEDIKLDGCSTLSTLSFLPTTLRTLTLDMDKKEPGSLESVENASLPNLEYLSIAYCPRLTRLALDSAALPRLYLKGCHGLQNLDLTGCRGLKELDCQEFSSMQELILDECQSLTTLPFLPTTLRKLSLKISDNEVGSLAWLEEVFLPHLKDLHITHCPELKRLNLQAPSLQRLYLTFCWGLEYLDCRGLSSLEYVNLNGCSCLVTLPFLPTTLRTLTLDMREKEPGRLESVADASLPNLEELSMTYCPKLRRLAVGSTSLHRLDLRGCSGLQNLDLTECSGLEVFDCHDLSSLEDINLNGCSSLTTLSFLPTTLRRLTFDMDEGEPGSLESVQDASLQNLEYLSMTYCPNLTRLAVDSASLHHLDLAGCSGLQNLDLTGCSELKELDCKDFSSMQELILDACQSLTTLPFLPTTLRKLSLKISRKEVGSLKWLEEASLPHVEDLHITRCPKLKRVNLQAPSLQRLNLTFCWGLEYLDCTGLSSLEYVNLDGCSCLATLPFLPTTLRTLTLDMHEKEPGSLENVADASLPNLEELSMTYCPKLTRLALESTSLQRLDLTGCSGLQNLDLTECSGLKVLDCKGLSNLKELQLNLCTSLTVLSLLPTTLQKLVLCMDNYKRGSLQSMKAYLPGLQELCITWCPKFKRLDVDAACLRRLNLSGCVGLEELNCRDFSCLEELDVNYCSSLKKLRFDPSKLRRFSFFYGLD